MLNELLYTVGATLVALLLGALALHMVPLFGEKGKRMSEALCRAPGLDGLITYFTALPMIIPTLLLGWVGLLGGIIGQVLTVMIWTVVHEITHPRALTGPRIVHVINRAVGRWRNHGAVWLTALCVPLFWLVRLAQYVVYPPITRLVRLPRYRDEEWVAVSRQKFKGLVGHDLIWCLYCDWMTGVWSLGSEMLRNVESFWCPIRFSSENKCANCKVDFPDIDGGWVKADGSMADVVAVLEKHYHRGDHENPWFGHPARMTVKGKVVEAPPAEVVEGVEAKGVEPVVEERVEEKKKVDDGVVPE